MVLTGLTMLLLVIFGPVRDGVREWVVVEVNLTLVLLPLGFADVFLLVIGLRLDVFMCLEEGEEKEEENDSVRVVFVVTELLAVLGDAVVCSLVLDTIRDETSGTE